MTQKRLTEASHEDQFSYLLRIWRSGPEDTWRASLQSVQTGERRMFADLESLLSFIVASSHDSTDFPAK